MINFETAKKLKEAGLPWEPKKGDWYLAWGTNMVDLITFDRSDIVPENIIWLPSLDQLLAEIRNQNWLYELKGYYGGGGEIEFWYHDWDNRINFCGKLIEEAAAQALLRIMEQEEVV